MITGRMLNKDFTRMFEESDTESSMVDEIGNVFLVVSPGEKQGAEDIVGEYPILDLVKMAMAGSLKPESILGIYKNEGKAKKAAQDAVDSRDEDLKYELVQKDYHSVAISGANWKKVLSAAKLAVEPMRGSSAWKWMGTGIEITATIDPMTGKNFDRAVAELTPDQAGEVSIEGGSELVGKAAEALESLADGEEK